MDANKMAGRLRDQAQKFLRSEHPWRVSHHNDALNVAANLEAEPPSPGMIAHAVDAIAFFETQLDGVH